MSASASGLRGSLGGMFTLFTNSSLIGILEPTYQNPQKDWYKGEHLKGSPINA